jgi:hypothetical protein
MNIRTTTALALAVAAIAAPTATAAVDPVDPGTCHHHELSCPSHAGQPATRIVTVAANGFDWTDAGIGAGTALGAAFVVAGFAALLRRPHRVAA